MPSAVVTFNGRITLPNNVLKQLGLKTGDSVDFVEIEKGRFAITHRPEPAPDSPSAEAINPRGWVPQLHFSNSAD
jgi:bifunctional DNA-binding transcriptional regulator/antitoxin component of YhaV-PrlF toxin-antitoxin module